MSQQPSPGWAAPGYGQPGHELPPGSGWSMPATHPGVVPLRPLTFGDFFDGAFKTIRRNPTAMVGLAACVTTAFLVIPVLLTSVLAATGGLRTNLSQVADGDLTFLDAASALSAVGAFAAALATVVLNGMLVRVVAEAVLGRRTSAGQAWQATRGRLLRLLALTALNVLVVLVLLGLPAAAWVLAATGAGIEAGFLVGVPLLLAGVACLAFVHVRFFLLAAPALVLERCGVLASMRRAGQLSHRQLWRLLGVWLLTALVVGAVSQVLAFPLSLLGVAGPILVPGTGGTLALVFTGYVSHIVVGAVTTPFASAVVALQYVDQRIRKEGLDVALIAAAQQGSGQAPHQGQH